MWSSFSVIQKRNYALVLLVALMYFCSGSMMLYLQRYFLSIGADEQTSGTLVAFAIIPFVIFSMISGHLAGVFGAKRLVVIGCIIHAAVSFCFLYVDQVSPILYFYRLMQGLGHVCVFTPLFVEVGKIVPDRFKARGIGYFAVAIQFGTASGSALGEYIINNFDYSCYFVAISVITSFCALVCLLIKGDDRSTKKDLHNDNKINDKIPSVVIGGLVMILVLGSVFGTILQFIPTYYDELLKVGEISGVISCKYFLTSGLLTVAFVRIAAGGVTDGKHRNKIISVCHIGLLITILLITLIRSVEISLMVSIMFGLSYGLLYPTTNAMVLTNTSQRLRGRVSGLLTMLFEVGFRGFAIFAGIFVHNFSYSIMFYALFAFYLIGVLFYYVLIEVRRDGVLLCK